MAELIIRGAIAIQTISIAAAVHTIGAVFIVAAAATIGVALSSEVEVHAARGLPTTAEDDVDNKLIFAAPNFRLQDFRRILSRRGGGSVAPTSGPWLRPVPN